MTRHHLRNEMDSISEECVDRAACAAPSDWIITADEEQLRQLRERRARPPGFYSRARWAPPQPETGHSEGAQL